jgi:hypothetical protein
MKKTLTTIALLAGAVAGYSQSATFADYGQPGSMELQIFNTQATTPAGAVLTPVTYGGFTVQEYLGNTASDSPAGSVVFTSPLSGNNYDAQFLVGSGQGDSLSGLSTFGAVEHFYTAAANTGFFKGTQGLVVPSVDAGNNFTVAFAAWTVNSAGSRGAATSLAEAQSYESQGAAGYFWGISTTANMVAATGTEFNPTVPNTIEGFAFASVPEPSTIALGVMGASALLFRRRK